MTSRRRTFLNFECHPMLGRDFKKLSKTDILTCLNFIDENEKLNRDDFAEKANRWMLDQERPKRYSLMWALVSQSNYLIEKPTWIEPKVCKKCNKIHVLVPEAAKPQLGLDDSTVLGYHWDCDCGNTLFKKAEVA